MSQLLKYLALKAYPRILGKEFEYSLENKLSFIDTTKHNWGNQKGVTPWAFIRVKNEEVTMLPSLESIRKVISNGVIAFNDCTDKSEEFILNFCQKNPGFIPFKYPFHVKPIESDLRSIPYINTLACYYNTALSLIPQNVWVIKLDLDQIYLPEVFKQSFFLPKNKKETVSYSRLNIIRNGDKTRVFSYQRPHDQILIFNDGLKFKNIEFLKDGKRCYVEVLDVKHRRAHYLPPCSNIHFPFEKNYRSAPKDAWENSLSLEEFLCNSEFSREIPKDLNQEFINNTISSFFLKA